MFQPVERGDTKVEKNMLVKMNFMKTNSRSLFHPGSLFSVQVDARGDAIVNVDNAPVVRRLLFLRLDEQLLLVGRHQRLGHLLDDGRVDLIDGQRGQMPLVTVEPVS